MVDISIIIPAYNEEKQIEILLRAIAVQITSQKYEVIVVDNGSRDDTQKVAKKFGAKIIFIKKGCYISAVRNIGAKNASGNILAFIDADCEPHENWLQNGYEAFINNGDVGIVGGAYNPPRNSTWVQRAWNSVRVKNDDNANFVTSGNLFIKKDLFVNIGGFDEAYETGEDYDLCLRISENYRIVLKENLQVVHYGDPLTLSHLIKKEIWYGKNTKDVLKRKIIYMPFWSSIFIVTTLIASIFCIIFGQYEISIITLICVLTFLCVITFGKCLRVKCFKYYPQLLVINGVYLIGRTISLIQFFK